MRPSVENPDLEYPPPNSADQQSLVRSLAELRSGRRLEKVTASIESFLFSQVLRLNESLDQCKLAVDENEIVQRVMANFEQQKADWENDRQAEIRRLSEASEKLIASWEQLENERQAWQAQCDSKVVGRSQ